MWKLMVTPKGGEWVQEGEFATITAAVRRIGKMEDRTDAGLFLKVHFATLTDEDGESDERSDTECLSHLHFDGRDHLYGIRRAAP